MKLCLVDPNVDLQSLVRKPFSLGTKFKKAPGAAAVVKIASTIGRRRDLNTQNQSMDVDDRDPGQVFAIPDLWGPSKWLAYPEGHSSFLFSELRLEGLLIPLRVEIGL